MMPKHSVPKLAEYHEYEDAECGAEEPADSRWR